MESFVARRPSLKQPFLLTNALPPDTLLTTGFLIPLKPDHQSAGLNNCIVVHASRAPYIVFGVMLGGIGVCCLFLGLLVDRSFLKPGTTFLAAYGIVVLWLRSFEVKLDGEVLCVLPSLDRSFFSGMKLIEPKSGSVIGQGMKKMSLATRSELPFGWLFFQSLPRRSLRWESTSSC